MVAWADVPLMCGIRDIKNVMTVRHFGICRPGFVQFDARRPVRACGLYRAKKRGHDSLRGDHYGRISRRTVAPSLVAVLDLT